MRPLDRFKSVVYSVFGIIVIIIAIRVILKFIGANTATPFVDFWYNFSYIFMSPWDKMFPDMLIGKTSAIEISSLIGMLFYIVFGVIIERTVEQLKTTTSKNTLYSTVNGIFKVIEFILATRFFLKLFTASTESVFVKFMYGISSIIYEPFAGIVKDYRYDNIVVEISTILIFVIIIILDIGVDSLMKSMLDKTKR